MRRLQCAGLLAWTALSACASGGGGGSPMPAPPPPTNSNLTSLQYSQQFANASSGLTTNLDKVTRITSGTSAHAPSLNALTIAYDATTKGYTVSFGGTSAAFTSANVLASGTNAVATTYETKSGSLQNDLVLFNPGSGNTTLALTYSSYGAWQRLTDNGGSLGIVQDFFVFGIPTLASDLPKTGTASYQSIIDGFWVTSNDVRALAGTGTLTADFLAGTTSVTLNLRGVSSLTGLAYTLDNFTGTGPIDGPNVTFSGTLSPTTSAYSGTYTGRFFGPAATEAGAVFNLHDGVGGVVDGVIIGHK